MAELQEPLLMLSHPQAAVGTEVLASRSSCPDVAGPHPILHPSQQGGSVFTCWTDHSRLALMLVTCAAHLHGHLSTPLGYFVSFQASPVYLTSVPGTAVLSAAVSQVFKFSKGYPFAGGG